MKLNKEKFLKSELGGNLQECVTAWDHWLTELRSLTLILLVRNIEKQEKLLIGVRHSGKYFRQ